MSKAWTVCIGLGSLFVLGLWNPVFAQETGRVPLAGPLPIETVLSAREFVDEPPSLSSDGRWLAHSVRDPKRLIRIDSRKSLFTDSGVPPNKDGTDIWIVDTSSGYSKNLTEGIGSNWGPVWSPDGQYLAFYSDRSGRANLWIYDQSSSKVRRVSDKIVRPYGRVESVCWTPDSKRILTKIMPGDGGLASASARPDAESAAAAQETIEPGATVTVYRSHVSERPEPDAMVSSQSVSQDARTKAEHADLALIDLKNGEILRIARSVNATWYGISPDGSHVGFTTFKGQADGNSSRNIFDLFVVSPGTQPQRIATDIQVSVSFFYVSWSPDSQWLSYRTSGRDTNGEPYVVSTLGGTPRRATNGKHPSFSDFGGRAPIWDAEGRNLYFIVDYRTLWRVSIADGTATKVPEVPGRRILNVVSTGIEGHYWSPDRGRSLLVRTINDKTKQNGFFRINLTTGNSTKLLEQDKMYAFNSYQNLGSVDGGQVVFMAQDVGHDKDFWVADGEFMRPRQLTHLNPEFDHYDMGRSELVEWETLDGREVQGALLLPQNYEHGKKVPLIVWVYPLEDLSSYLNNFGLFPYLPTENMQLLATRGYAVLLPDAPAAGRTLMLDLAKTVLPGVNKVVELGIADPDRIGLMGGSFGGYSALALLVQTTRFKAAVMRSGFGNLLSFYGEMGKDDSAIGIAVLEEDSVTGMGGTPWQFRDRYLENSPVLYLDRVKTPLLIVHGDQDDNAAPFLADEVFVDLRRLGKEVVYAKYHGEGHLFPSGHANQLDCAKRMIEWFDRYLRNGAGAKTPRGNN